MSGKKESKKESNTQEEPQCIEPNNFDVDNLSIQPLKPSKGENKYGTYQTIFWPQYKYPTGKSSTFIVRTNEIKITNGGCVTVDGTYRKTEAECAFIWLTLEEDKELRELFSSIDETFKKKIIDDENEDCLKIQQGGSVVKWSEKSPLVYNEMVRRYEPESGDVTKEYDRIKVKLAINHEDPGDENDPNIIMQLLILSEDKRMKKKSIKKIADLRKYFGYGGKAKFLLEVNKFFVQNSPTKSQDKKDKKKTYACGFNVVCKFILVTEAPSSKKKSEMTSSMFGVDDADVDNEEDEKQDDNSSSNKKNADKKSSKSNKTKSEDENSDDDSNKKSNKKSNKNENSDKDKSDEEKSEEESNKKSSKSSKVNKEKSDEEKSEEKSDEKSDEEKSEEKSDDEKSSSEKSEDESSKKKNKGKKQKSESEDDSPREKPKSSKRNK